MPTTTTTESHSLTYPAEGATGWYATWETLAQQITDYLDDVNDIRVATLKDNNGNEAVVINTTTSAVNHLGITNAATSNDPSIEALGDDTNIGIDIKSKGAGEVGIFTNGNEAINVDSAGIVTKPLQPCVIAKGASQLNVTGNGTTYTVVYSTEVVDRNNNFDGTSTFTAPVTGVYSISGMVALNNVGSATQILVKVVTSNETYDVINLDAASIAASGNIRIPYSIMADMDASDTAYITVFLTGTGADTADIPANNSFLMIKLEV